MEEYPVLLKDNLSKYAQLKDKYINLFLNNYKNTLINPPFYKELFDINTKNVKEIVNKFIKKIKDIFTSELDSYENPSRCISINKNVNIDYIVREYKAIS